MKTHGSEPLSICVSSLESSNKTYEDFGRGSHEADKLNTSSGTESTATAVVIRCCGGLGGSKLCLRLIRYKCAKSYLFMRVFLGVEAWLMDTAFQCLCAAAVRAREVWGISQGWWLPRAPLLAALTSCQPLSINLMFTVSVPKFRMLHQRSVSFQDPSSTNVIFLFSIFFGKLHTPLDNSGSLAMS